MLVPPSTALGIVVWRPGEQITSKWAPERTTAKAQGEVKCTAWYRGIALYMAIAFWANVQSHCLCVTLVVSRHAPTPGGARFGGLHWPAECCDGARLGSLAGGPRHLDTRKNNMKMRRDSFAVHTYIVG